MMSILRKGFLLLLLLLFLLLAGTLVFGGDQIFSHALKKYGPVAFRQPVRFQQAELSVLGGSAGVEDFHVGSKDNPLMDVKAASLDIGTLALLDGRVHIENARLDGVRLHLAVQKDGTLSFDSGPPPPEVVKEGDASKSKAAKTPAQKRDLVQIFTEYWDRYQQYKEYYDKVGLGGGADESEEDDAIAERVKYPGIPDYVRAAQAVAANAGAGVFWLEHAQIQNFSWETMDLRNGKPILPALKEFSLQLDAVGIPPSGINPPAVYAGKGVLEAGGALEFQLQISRDENPSTLSLSAEELPVSSIAAIARRSFPFVIQGGTLDLLTDGLQFQATQLSGSVRIVLRKTKLKSKASSPTVLGVEPQEFCSLLNAALQKQPIAFVIQLGGTPTSPSFSIKNETDLGNLLGGAIQAEVERRAQELVDEQLGELEEKASELLEDKVGSQLQDKLGGRLRDKIPSGLLGGKKKN